MPELLRARRPPALPTTGFLSRLARGDPRTATAHPPGRQRLSAIATLEPLVRVPAALLVGPTDLARRAAASGLAGLPDLGPGPARPHRDPTVAPERPSSRPRAAVDAPPPRTPEPAPTAGPPVTASAPLPDTPEPAPTAGPPVTASAPLPSTLATHPTVTVRSPAVAAVGTAAPVANTAPAVTTPQTPAAVRDEVVALVRGEPAEIAASRASARATSTAETVHLPDRHGPLGSPAADALLAHELVHVRARRAEGPSTLATPASRDAEEAAAVAEETAVRQRRPPAGRPAVRPLDPPAPSVAAPRGPAAPAPPVHAPSSTPPSAPWPTAAVALAPPAGPAAPDAPAAPAGGPARDPAGATPAAGRPAAVGMTPTGTGPEVSRAPEAPRHPGPAASPDEDRLDRLADLVAARLRHDLLVERERRGRLVDLSRW